MVFLPVCTIASANQNFECLLIEIPCWMNWQSKLGFFKENVVHRLTICVNRLSIDRILAQQDICSITERLNMGFCARLGTPSRVFLLSLSTLITHRVTFCGFTWFAFIGVKIIVYGNKDETKNMWILLRNARVFVDKFEKRIWWMYQRDYEVDSQNINIMWMCNFEHRLKPKRHIHLIKQTEISISLPWNVDLFSF